MLSSGKKLIIAVALVIVFAAAIFILQKGLVPKPKNNQNNEITRSAKIYFDPAKGTLPNFPTGLPLEKPLAVLDNSQIKITSPSSVYFESTFEYISGASIKTSVAAYRDYFKKNKWVIVVDDGAENVHTIYGTKQNQTLSYTYSHNVVDGKNYIKIIHTYPGMSAAEQKLIEELQK